MSKLWMVVVTLCFVLAGSLAAQPTPEPDPWFQPLQPNFWFQPPPPPHPEPHAVAHSSRSFLGVGIADIDEQRAKEMKLPEVRGVEVTHVESDSPADKAGLQKGDVILEYNGQRVVGMEQLGRLVRETPIGRTVSIEVSRGGNVQTLSATIEARKGPTFAIAPKVDFDRLKEEMEQWREFQMPDQPRPWMAWRSSMLGVEAESLEGQLAEYFGVKEGVLVRSVIKDSAADKAGLQAGDVITKVEDETVTSPRELSRIIRSKRSQQTFPITVIRNRQEMTITVTRQQPERAQERPPRPPRPARVIRERKL
jgi:serine protease Do